MVDSDQSNPKVKLHYPQERNRLKKKHCCDRIRSKEQSCHCKVLTSHYIRWGVVRMNFDFKDLMAFGMFILALLTFIIKFCQ